jgi:hypothetical protein
MNAITAARTAKAAAVAAFQNASSRTRKAALESLEDAEFALSVAIREYEQSVRAANPTVTQAEVMRVVSAA